MRPFFILLALCCMQTSIAQETTPSIYVSAKHEIEIEPDEIWVQIVITEYYEEEYQAGKTYQDYKTVHPLAEIEPLLNQAFKNAKIKDEQVTILDTGNNWRPMGKDGLSTKSYRISLPDFACVEKLRNEVHFRGVNRFDISELRHKDKAELEMQAKVEALKKAKAKAQILAETLDQSIGQVITIVEGSVQPSNIMARGMLFANSAESDSDNMGAGNSFDFQKLKISMSVQVRFELIKS